MPAPPPLDPRALLVIEAQPERRAISRLCARLGMSTVEVSGVSAARRVLDQPNEDLSAVISDVALADGRGLSMVPRLRLPPRPVALVLVGGDELQGEATLALALGVHRLLRKPFSADAFESAMTTARKRTAEYRRWLDDSLVGERHDSWIEVLMAADPEVEVPSAPNPGFLNRMARMVISRGDLTPAEARLVPDLLLGRDYNSIAAVHGLSSETVRSHVKGILGKLNLSSAKQIWQVCVAEFDG